LFIYFLFRISPRFLPFVRSLVGFFGCLSLLLFFLSFFLSFFFLSFFLLFFVFSSLHYFFQFLSEISNQHSALGVQAAQPSRAMIFSKSPVNRINSRLLFSSLTVTV